MVKSAGFVAEYLQIVGRIARLIPYPGILVWKEFVSNPTVTLPNNINSIGSRMKDLYVVSGIVVLLSLASIPILMLLQFFNYLAAYFLLPLIILVLLLMPSIWESLGMNVIYVAIAIGALMMPIILFLYSLLESTIARVLGGSGNFRTHFNASVLPVLGLFITLLPLGALGVLMIVTAFIIGMALSPLIADLHIYLLFFLAQPLLVAGFFCLGLAFLYSIYLRYLSFKLVHRLSSPRAALAVIIPLLGAGGIALSLYLSAMAISIIAGTASMYAR